MFEKKKIINGVACLLMLIITASCGHKQEANTSLEEEEINQTYAYGICIDSLTLNHFKIEKGDHLSSILMNLGFMGNDAEQITETISPLYPPSKLQIGNTYATITTPDSTSSIQYLVFEK